MWSASDTRIATWLALCDIWPERLRLTPDEKRKKEQGGHAHYEWCMRSGPVTKSWPPSMIQTT